MKKLYSEVDSGSLPEVCAIRMPEACRCGRVIDNVKAIGAVEQQHQQQHHHEYGRVFGHLIYICPCFYRIVVELFTRRACLFAVYIPPFVQSFEVLHQPNFSPTRTRVPTQC